MGSREATVEYNDYSDGMDSFVSNDKFPLKSEGANKWRVAQDARIITLGEYDTRKGFDYHSEAMGSTQDQAITSTTGAADKSFNTVTRLAQIFTASASGRINKLEIRLKNDASATGTIRVELWTNASGNPGTIIDSSTIAGSDLTSSYAYYTARFVGAPIVTAATSYWVIVYVQLTGSGDYKCSSTTSATTALVSTDSGATWATTSYALNFKQHYATIGGVKGIFRAYKSDGTKVTLMAHGTTLSKVDEVTGALTTIKSGLSSNATHYRFVLVNDIVYYVNGFDGYRKWNFTTESQVNATNYTHICVHKGLMFLVESLDPNKVVFSNFAEYETFTSTDFIYVPSPKTGDPTSALVPLNGLLLLFTLNNKFILSGDDNATFSLDEAPDQKGTYTQETTTVDKNFVYYVSNDGIYRSNGSEAQLISKNNYSEILAMRTKATSVLCVSKGRLYYWYARPSIAYNDRCFVYNLNYGTDVIESYDTNAYVARAVNAFGDDNHILAGSSVVGQIMWQELESNDYHNLGGDINYLLQSHYMTAGSPSVLKEFRYWQPRFGAQSGNYSINCEYATDLRDNWQLYKSENVQGSGPIYGSGITYGSGQIYGTEAELQSYLYVPGEYRRIAIRYKHFAARQPQSFLGHTFKIQSRRMR